MAPRLRLPSRLIPPIRRETDPPSDDRAKRRRENIVYVCTVLGGLAAFATIVLAVTSLAGTSSSGAHGSRRKDPEGQLVITEAYVRNGAEESYTDQQGPLRQSLSSSPTIDVLLHNGSRRHLLVERAKTTIESYGYVYLCFSQGGGPLPEPPPHVTRLPVFPLQSEDVVETHLRDEIPPEESDSIPLLFDAPRPQFEGYGIYKLRVQLRVYGSKTPLNVGRFVLSMPSTLPSYDGYFPEDNDFFKQFISGPFKGAWLAVTWCLKRNLDSLQSVLSGAGIRSPELALLDRPVLASHWARLQDRTPPRRAALLLLRQRQAALAVFAASRSGDLVFESLVRRRAATALLDTAEKQLTASQPTESGEQEVRMALEIEQTPRGRQLLMEFERRLSALRSP
jgi:hypothetical protein